jgi:ABC-type antimicrobial peptide transport system permease subunit
MPNEESCSLCCTACSLWPSCGFFLKMLPGVVLLSGYILLAAGLVNHLRQYETQRVTAAFLLLPALLLLFVVAFHSPALQVMLALFAVKLILAFAVRW